MLPIIDFRAMTHSPGGESGGGWRSAPHRRPDAGVVLEWTLTVGLVTIKGFDGEQEVLVLQVLNLGEDGLQLWPREWSAGTEWASPCLQLPSAPTLSVPSPPHRGQLPG